MSLSRSLDSRIPTTILLVLSVLSLLLIATRPSQANLVRPWEGVGDFTVVMDYFNREGSEGAVDVVCVFSVPNSGITFVRDDMGRFRGELTVMVQLTAADGAIHERTENVELLTYTEVEAGSPTTYQIFNLTLPDVAARDGKLICMVEDLNQQRSGLYNLLEEKRARSELAGDWFHDPRADGEGLVIAEPVFLAGAPLGFWNPGDDIDDSQLTEHLHPNRRYGIENETLQVYFEIEPRPTADGGRAPTSGAVYLQILAKDLDFALRDTLAVDLDPISLASQGGTVGVYYEMDVNMLPPGVYQMSCAPLDAPGVPWLAEFDVIWSAAALNRDTDRVRGEGLTVFMNDDLDTFMAAGQAEREALLANFWDELDPMPETPYNEARMEFRRRVAYVDIYLGGFGPSGARDDRGLTYLLLGPPQSSTQQIIPTDPYALDDALIRVFDGYAPQRDGSWTRSDDSIVMPSTYQSRRELSLRRTGTVRESAFELWSYTNRGDQLFPNLYSERTLGLRFLFVDRNGQGRYMLEVSNAFDRGGASTIPTSDGR